MTLHAELASHFAEASDSSDFATGLSLLEHQGLISVTGGDADKFLQGQITCDLRELDQTHSSLGARCNPKGRMQSSFRIWRTTDGMLLSLARELVAPQLADLGKYAALYRQCQLADESDAWAGFGLWGEQAEQALTAAFNRPPRTTASAARTTASPCACRAQPMPSGHPSPRLQPCCRRYPRMPRRSAPTNGSYDRSRAASAR